MAEDKRKGTSIKNLELATKANVKAALERQRDAQIMSRAARARICELVADKLDEMVKAQIKKAIEGDTVAFTALLDRAHGKPAQALEVSGDGTQPIVFMPLELIQKHALQVAEDMAKKPVHVEARDITAAQ